MPNTTEMKVYDLLRALAERIVKAGDEAYGACTASEIVDAIEEAKLTARKGGERAMEVCLEVMHLAAEVEFKRLHPEPG
jgi:RNA polymerase-binding transcription factor DksA